MGTGHAEEGIGGFELAVWIGVFQHSMEHFGGKLISVTLPTPRLLKQEYFTNHPQKMIRKNAIFGCQVL